MSIIKVITFCLFNKYDYSFIKEIYAKPKIINWE